MEWNETNICIRCVYACEYILIRQMLTSNSREKKLIAKKLYLLHMEIRDVL